MSLVAAVRETSRRLINSVNPFYRNPIVVYADYNHLAGHGRLLNPDIERMVLLSILRSSSSVKDAIRGMQGEYYLEAAVVDGELRVNVFTIAYRATELCDSRVYNPEWRAHGLLQYILDTELDGPATLQFFPGSMGNCWYDRMSPAYSWTLPLDARTRQQLGWKVLS